MLVLTSGCAAVLLAGCAKHTDSSQTTTTTDTTTSAPAETSPGPATALETPAAATAAPAGASMSAATPGATGAETPAAAASGTFSFIDVPIYPGATADKSAHISMSSGDGSVVMNVYTTKDDSKTVAEWYKSHLPANWQNTVMTANDKTVGTFSQEQSGVGDQSVIVGGDNSAAVTRIQITTKHGK